MESKEMKLKVAEAFSQGDVGRSIARIDRACMQKLDLMDGDIIEIEGKKLTATIVASSQSDIGLGIISYRWIYKKKCRNFNRRGSNR